MVNLQPRRIVQWSYLLVCYWEVPASFPGHGSFGCTLPSLLKKKNHGELVIYCFVEEVYYTPFQFAPVAKCAYLIPDIHETNQLIIYHFNLDAEFVEFAGIISFI